MCAVLKREWGGRGSVRVVTSVTECRSDARAPKIHRTATLQNRVHQVNYVITKLVQ